MSTSPDFGIPYIAASQAQPEITHNEGISLMQALLNGVIDRGLNTPPGSPTPGDAYIVGTAPTGAWAGRANRIAVFFGTAWLFVPGNDSDGVPITMGARQEGIRIWVRDENTFYVWDGSVWIDGLVDVDAVDVDYDNGVSGLTATDVQGAIDELAGELGDIDADEVAYDNSTSGLTSTDVQGGIDELSVSQRNQAIFHLLGF